MVELAVTPDSGAAFERAFAVQAAAVQANEPGNRLYELFKSTTLSDSYTLVEIYEDDAALQAHRASPHMAANRPLTALSGRAARHAGVRGHRAPPLTGALAGLFYRGEPMADLPESRIG